MYSEEDRYEVLNKMKSDIYEFKDVISLILVGSGSYGFKDEYSDIDCVLAINNDANEEEILDEIYEYLEKNYKTQIMNKINSPARKLIICLYDNWLEINFGIVKKQDLIALKKHWKVLFDKSNTIDKQLHSSWNN
jgi:predicted nucleotidyltransferase